MEDNPLLPVNNKYSLIGYYVAFTGFIPIVGMPGSVAAVVLGMLALQYEKKKHVPGAKGHAVTALVLGLTLGVIHVGLALVLLVAVLVESL